MMSMHTMTEMQARQTLNHLFVAIQKVRSNLAEELGAEYVAPQMARVLAPTFLFGLEQTMRRIEAGGQLDPLTFYNLVSIVHQEPAISSWLALQGRPLPEPSWVWLEGWATYEEE
jgi:hypothetical protein